MLTLTSRSDTRGSGFIIDGTEIRGKTANCTIKNKGRMEMSFISLRHVRQISCCHDVEMALRIIDKDKVSRFFPGLPELETPYYYRCPR